MLKKYRFNNGTLSTNQITSEATSQTVTTEGENAVQTQSGVVADENVIKDLAGILPNSFFYSIERGIEQLQIAITQSQEKLAALKAQFATERAAEAVVMTNEGEEELAIKATAEYIKMLASATEHINNAIEAKEEVKGIVEQAEKRIESGMKQIEKADEKMEKVQEKASEDAKKIEEKAKKEKDKEIEKAKKEEEKSREEMKKSEEKAREEAKKAAEKAREEAKKVEEQDRD